MRGSAGVLVVEDKASERKALARLLRMEGLEVFTAAGQEQALSYADESIALVVSDLKLGGDSGIELLRQWRRRRPETSFLMVTAFADVKSAVEAIKLGAEDYLTKPVNPEQLVALVHRVLDARPNIPPPLRGTTGDGQGALAGMLGQAHTMREVFDRIVRAAQTESTVLILGESGTGKELAARAIHEHSRRREGPYVAVNMAAIPSNLVESELFGHTAGSFTGAVSNRIGRFEAAQQGTIFIDEIGDFEISAQAKLLRVLEARNVTPVGSNDERKVDVRVVAATSRKLPVLVAERRFREDLYYRLNVVSIELPPLRARRDDIGLLVEHFLGESCLANQRPRPAIDLPLAEYLQAFDWPGNVRQLRNAIESMVVMSKGDLLTLQDLPPHLLQTEAESGRAATRASGGTLGELERTAVLEALDRAGGNRTHAAEALGISVRTLQRRLKDWHLDPREADDNRR